MKRMRRPLWISVSHSWPLHRTAPIPVCPRSGCARDGNTAPAKRRSNRHARSWAATSASIAWLTVGFTTAQYLRRTQALVHELHRTAINAGLQAFSRAPVRITFSRTAMVVPAKAMTRARWKVWSATRGGTSWLLSPGSRVGRPSMSTWRSNAANGKATCCAATARLSALGSSAIGRS